jgi:hypothetical protein
VIASHPRSYGKNEQILDPRHYLDTLRRRPAALDHADVFRRWRLPALFNELRTALEKQHGQHRGVKHFVRVLHLLDEHPLELVQRAIEMSRDAAGYDIETILLRVRRQRPDTAPAPLERAQQPELVRNVNVPLPDLSKFNQFLSHGDKSDARSE